MVGTHAVAVLRDFQRRPAPLARSRDDARRERGLADASAVTADHDQFHSSHSSPRIGIELLLDLAQFGDDLRQPLDQRLLLQVFTMRARRGPPDGLAGRNAAMWKNAGLAADVGLGSDVRLLAHSDLAAHHNIVLDDAAARQPGLRGDDDMPSDTAIVADVDQIVEFRSGADRGRAERSPIDANVGPEFHVVAEFNRAELRKLLVVVALEDITEAVGPHDAA